MLDQDAVAVDTEANPMFAYRERLCLIQISTPSRDAIIDPLAEDIDIGLLGGVFADARIAKILHGAEFDILQFKKAFPFEIRGLFDTRVAAASLSFPSPSLAAVLWEWLEVEVDKAHQRSDWGKRPLTAGQLEYARDDTRYLIALADLLQAELHDRGAPHLEEVASECRRVEMLVPDPRLSMSADDWIRIKGATHLDPVGQRVLRDVNRFRHQQAERVDRPLFKVLANDAMLTMARSKPTSRAELARTKALSPKLLDRFGADLADIIRRAVDRGPLKRLPAGRPQPEESLRGAQRPVFDAIRQFRKLEAERRQTDAALVLPKLTMVELARVRPVPESVEALVGTGLLEPWRIAHYGDGLAAAIRDRQR